jgi:hypothetical protein
MAKKKAAVKKAGRKVSGKKKRGSKTLTGFIAFPADSSAYVEFGDATKTQVLGNPLGWIYKFKAIAKKCDGTVNIRCFDFAATADGKQPYFMNVNPVSESEAEVQFGFDLRPIPDDTDFPFRPLEGELVVTVLTKKTVRVGPS